MTLVKICGVTTAHDATAIAAAGVDFIGINFSPRSPRSVSAPHASAVAVAARAATRDVSTPLRLVGIYVDATAEAIVAHHRAGLMDIAQLHGNEAPDFAHGLTTAGVPVWKACTLQASSREEVARWQAAGVGALVLDAAVAPGAMPGGTGRTIDWSQASEVITASALPVILAGGLTPDNVALAITQAAPWGVDVASGVELAPGHKDLAKVASFVREARRA